jgi:splicing factor 1
LTLKCDEPLSNVAFNVNVRLYNEAEPLRGRTLACKMRIEQLTQKMEGAHVELPPMDERSPSPPPAYDQASGQRTNGREQRIWDKWDAERREVVQETLKCDPLYKPPHGHRALVKELKLYIPVKENPGRALQLDCIKTGVESAIGFRILA